MIGTSFMFLWHTVCEKGTSLALHCVWFRMGIPGSDSSQGNIAPLPANLSRSHIEEFYHDTNIFITGGTGFLGNVLLEKLIRCCPGINKIYLLVRPRSGKDIAARIEEIFKGPLFKAMKVEAPDYLKKLAFISGDLELDECGISAEDQETLKREVNVVFHAAATVRFNADLSTAINVNVRATRDLVNMACQMKNLKAFVYVSTAFTNCLREVVHEYVYDPPIPGDTAIRMIGKVDDNFIKELPPLLKGTWPNTYVFTKCIAESVVRELGKSIPVAIVRPAIVTSIAKAPICGWTNNCYAATGFTAGLMTGILRTFQTDVSCVAEVVPVDYVINAIIACAWDIGTTFVSEQASLRNGLTTSDNYHTADGMPLTRVSETSLQDSSDVQTRCGKLDSPIPVYNFVNRQKITWQNFVDMNKDAIAAIPSVSAVWCCLFIARKTKFEYLICSFFLNFLPAFIGDVCCGTIGKKPRFLRISRRMDRMSNYLSFFCSNQWEFKTENVSRLWGKLSEADKKTFYFDMKDLNWKDYIYHYVHGVREHVLHDSNATIPEGRRKRFRFLVAHYALVLILFLVCAYGIFMISSSLRPYLNLTNLKHTMSKTPKFTSN